MKQVTTILAILVGFTMNAQLGSVTENSKIGQRLTVSNTNNHGDIGSNAVDLSYSNSVSTTRGATGTASTAMGQNTTASGPYSTALGKSNTASAYASVAMGEQNTASGSRAFAMGYYNNIASGENSVAIGYQTTASGSSSVAMGSTTTASANYSTAIGYKTTASGKNSFAIGEETTASDFGSLTIGSYNSVNSSVTTGGNANNYDTDNAAFVIGNGYIDNSDPFNSITVKSDAFVVYFNGNATLAGDLTINSDERLKDNIQPLGSTLNKLHQIEGKTYSFKKDEEHTPKIGVLAQEVQAVFPELVTEGVDGILSVNYQGLVPVLINAINEQDAKIAALEEMVRFLAVQQSQTTSSVAAN